MQPTNPFQHRGGSFSKQELPKTEKQAPLAEEVREKVAEPAIEGADKAAQTDSSASSADERTAKIKQWIEEISTELDIKVSEDDIRNYILKGRMSKEVSLVPGLMRGTLQTLKIDDLQSIDSAMAKVRDESKFTPRGLENEEAIITLAHAWTHADGKSIGDTATIREEKIRKMGSLFVERASAARVNFDA